MSTQSFINRSTAQFSSIMKKSVIPFVLFATLVCVVAAFTYSTAQKNAQNAVINEKVKWITWQEAYELNKKQPKKMIVDVYTDWCGWCKVMDKNTFTNDEIADYLNKNFYCIKLNAEMREAIDFAGQKFEFVAQGARGYHTLAAALLDGQMSYPTVVYLNEKYERVMISPGYKTPEQIFPELKYTAEEIYTKQTWADYKNQPQGGK